MPFPSLVLRAAPKTLPGGKEPKWIPLIHDPAVDKWVAMRESMHKGFRFRRQNIGPILALAVVMPACIYQLCVYEKNQEVDPLMNVRGVPRNKADRKASDLETNPHLKFWDPYGGCEGKEGDERSAAIKNKMGQ